MDLVDLSVPELGIAEILSKRLGFNGGRNDVGIRASGFHQAIEEVSSQETSEAGGMEMKGERAEFSFDDQYVRP